MAILDAGAYGSVMSSPYNARRLNPRIPIIALTAYALPEDEQRCIAAGMDAYVTKPLRAEALRAALVKCGLGAKTPDEGAPQAKVARPGQ